MALFRRVRRPPADVAQALIEREQGDVLSALAQARYYIDRASSEDARRHWQRVEESLERYRAFSL